MQTDPRLPANLPVKLPRMNPLGFRGAMGGANPYGASPRLYSPPRGGATGCMFHKRTSPLRVPWEPYPKGGEVTLASRLAGSE